MHKNLKIWLILAAVLMVVGLVLIVISMSAYNWDFTQLDSVSFETNTHTPYDDFHSIQMDTDTADISILPSLDGTCKVVCKETENLKHTVEILDGVLTIREEDSRKWYEHIGFSFSSARITVYLPEAEYQDLTIQESTGDIAIAAGLHFHNMDIKTSTGDVENYASAWETIGIHTDTGYIRIEAVSAGTLDVTVSTGDVTIVDATCDNLISEGDTGDLNLKNVIAQETFKIERSTGDVSFDKSDATDILVETETGDVTGSLLSDKVFYTETDTGKVSVPPAGKGGNCVIHTDTGDIRITVSSNS